MTSIDASIIITVKVADISESHETKISFHNIEADLNAAFQEGRRQSTAVLFDLLESNLHAFICSYKNWKNVGTDKRSVLMEAGTITYRRHIYLDEQGNRRKPFDELIGLQAYQRNSNKVETMVASLATVSSFRDVAELFSYVTKEYISPSTVYRMTGRVGKKLRAIEQMEDEQNIEPGTIKTNRLMAEADGVIIRLQGEAQKRAEVKVAVFYTGKTPIALHRNRLLNKFMTCQLGMSNETWQKHLSTFADRTFKLSDVAFAQIGGDGAKWVRNSFEYLGVPMLHLLDRYHVIRSLRSAFAQHLDLKETLAKLFSEGFTAVEADLLEIISNSKGAVREQQIKCFDYLRSNQDAITDLDKRGFGDLGFCSMGAMEGNVGKLIAKRMKGHGRSWSIQGAQNILAVIRYKNLTKTETFAMTAMPVPEPKSRWRYQRYKAPEWTPNSASIPIFSSTHATEPWVQLFKSKVNGSLSINAFF